MGKLKYVINCVGCGRTVTDFVPIPSKDGSIEVECGNCSYLLASFEEEIQS